MLEITRSGDARDRAVQSSGWFCDKYPRQFLCRLPFMAIAYPLTLTFKLVTLSPEVQVNDANGQLLLQVKQKQIGRAHV